MTTMLHTRHTPLALFIKKALGSAMRFAGYALLTHGVVSVAHAGPVGGDIVGGSGAIHQTGLTTTIQQNSSALAINWHSHVGSAKNLPTPEHLNALCRTYSGITPDS